MELLDYLRKQLEEEVQITRKFLALVPMNSPHWKPHEKSMELGNLANHITDLPSWVEMALTTDGIDFETSTHSQPKAETNEELLYELNKRYKLGLNALTTENIKDFPDPWTLRTGKQVHAVMPKIDMLRNAISQIIHHRAQLGVYLRLNNIPIPGSYGPSADETF